MELQAYERERQTPTEMHGAVARATSLYGGSSDRELIEKERQYLMTAPLPTMTFQLEKYRGLPAFHLVAGLIEQMEQEADDDDDSDDDPDDDSDDDKPAAKPAAAAQAKKAPAKKSKTVLGGVPAKKSQMVLEGVQKGTKRESQKSALANLRHDEKMLQKAEGLDRKRSLAASKSDEGPTFAEVDGRWLRVKGYSEALAKRSPWIVHPLAKRGKAKGAKPAAALSRNFSVTRIAKDDSANVWVQGDVVPQMKKEELVGAAVSVDNMAICQAVQPMAIGVRPPKAAEKAPAAKKAPETKKTPPAKKAPAAKKVPAKKVPAAEKAPAKQAPAAKKAKGKPLALPPKKLIAKKRAHGQ